MMKLANRRCTASQKTDTPLAPAQALELLGALHADWSMTDGAKRISRDFQFKNFYETMAFVNALAWSANREDHHPDLEVGYKHCLVHFSTHAIGGLSENDFICAAKADALLS